MMWSGSDEKTSSHCGGVGGVGEAGSVCVKDTSTGSVDVGDASVFGGVKRLVGAGAEVGCSVVVHGGKGGTSGEGSNGVGEGKGSEVSGSRNGAGEGDVLRRGER